jgi:hypothetical protein
MKFAEGPLSFAEVHGTSKAVAPAAAIEGILLKNSVVY